MTEKSNKTEIERQTNTKLTLYSQQLFKDIQF